VIIRDRGLLMTDPRACYQVSATVLSVVVTSFIATAANAQVWFHKTVTRDLTGSARPDTLELTAIGHQPDSLNVSLVIKVAGRVAYRDTWKSVYYFQYDDAVEKLPRAHVDSVVRAHLNKFFGDDDLGSVDTADLRKPAGENEDGARSRIARQLKEDRYMQQHGIGSRDDLSPGDYQAIRRMPVDTSEVTAIATNILRHTKVSFTYFSGGESTQTIAWSPSRRRFFSVWGCC
jgi:hypothetical protein